MKRPLLASAAAVLVSSALLVSPAAAAGTPTANSVLSPTSLIQPVSKTNAGQLTITGLGSGSIIFWCWFRKC